MLRACTAGTSRVRVADVLRRIDPDELIALTRDLVRIPSVVRPGDPAATEAAVAVNDAVCEPAGTVTESGTVRAV